MSGQAVADKPKIGRPLGSYEYTPALADALDQLPEGSNTLLEIAAYLGITRKTVYEWMHRFPVFCDAITRARNRSDDRMETALYKSGLNGDNKAQVFWLKNRRPDNWKDKIEHEVKGEPIHFNFVFPSTPDRSEQVTAGQREVEGEVVDVEAKEVAE